LNIEITQNPNQDDLKTISLGLQSHNAKFLGDVAAEDELRFAVFAKDNAGKVVGGIRVVAFWDWLNIEVIWVDEKARGAGVGQQLLEKAEEFAIKNDFFFASLETTSFQAREFYEKQGYEVFGELDDFPKGHTMYYMKKALANNQS
jgi:ribosomal protein S18 acetylase RimI-like enzyme